MTPIHGNRPAPVCAVGRPKRVTLAAVIAGLLVSACGTTVGTQQLGASGAAGSSAAASDSIGNSGLSGEGTGLDGLTAPAPGDVPPVAGDLSGGMTSQVGGSNVASSEAEVPGGQGSVPDAGSTGRVTKPIKLGVLGYDFTKLVKSVGGSSSSSSDPNAIPKALIKAINARGGLAGRKIEGSYYSVDGTASDYSSQEQAACEQFTRDDRVDVVLGGGSENFYACVHKAGLAHINSSPTDGFDSETLRRVPTAFNIIGLATDRQAVALIEQAVKTKWLTKSNKVGLLLTGCPWGARAYEQLVLPRAQRYGFTVEKVEMSCANGTQSVAETTSVVQNAVLQFRGSGVDRVMILAGGGDAAAYLLFTQNAEQQNYRPGYIIGTNAIAQVWHKQGLLDPDQAANTRGSGWVPVVDVHAPQQTKESRACSALARSGGAPAEPGGMGQYSPFCDMFLGLEAGLLRSGGVSDAQAVRGALEGLGTSFISATNITGSTRFTREVHDGAGKAAPFAFLAECKCFRYTTSADATPVL